MIDTFSKDRNKALENIKYCLYKRDGHRPFVSFIMHLSLPLLF